MQVMIAKLAIRQRLYYHCNITQIILFQVAFNVADASQTLQYHITEKRCKLESHGGEGATISESGEILEQKILNLHL